MIKHEFQCIRETASTVLLYQIFCPFEVLCQLHQLLKNNKRQVRIYNQMCYEFNMMDVSTSSEDESLKIEDKCKPQFSDLWSIERLITGIFDREGNTEFKRDC